MDCHDVEYLRHGDRPLLARIYQPRGTGPFPLLLEVHGGVWTIGNRLMDELVCRALAASGVVVAAIDFRLGAEGAYPASMADVNYATRWLKVHAAELNARADRMGALGSSSGGHQAMLSALRPRDPRYAALPLPGGEDVDASLAYAILCWAIVDPPRRYRWAKAAGVERLVRFHDGYWGDEAAMVDGSPQRIVEEGGWEALPPVLLIQGTADRNMPPGGLAEPFAVAYRRAGGSARLELFEGQPHGFITPDTDEAVSTRALAAMRAFVHEHAGPGGG